MRRLRACPVCPKCGSKKFKRIMSGEGKDVAMVECLRCSKRMKI